MTIVAASASGLFAFSGVLMLGGPTWAAFGLGLVTSYVVIGWDADR